MTESDIRAILERSGRASPGPWGITRYAGGLSFNGPSHVYGPPNPMSDEPGMPTRIPRTDEDREFIAAARRDVPDLARECLRLMEENKGLRHPVGRAPHPGDPRIGPCL